MLAKEFRDYVHGSNPKSLMSALGQKRTSPSAVVIDKTKANFGLGPRSKKHVTPYVPPPAPVLKTQKSETSCAYNFLSQQR
jgi:hypothetical protein